MKMLKALLSSNDCPDTRHGLSSDALLWGDFPSGQMCISLDIVVVLGKIEPEQVFITISFFFCVPSYISWVHHCG